jgi:hypothetical protein
MKCYRVKDMYQPEEIKDCVNGVDGTFLMVNGVPAFSDIDFDVTHVCNALHYLILYLDENRRASRMYVIGKKKDAVFYLEGRYTMGVRMSKNTNIHLLHRTVGKMLNYLKIKIKNKSPAEDTHKKSKFFLTS